MANYDQPVTAAREASESMRALAHATLKFGDDAGATYDVLGDLLAITSALTSTLEHLSQAHTRFADRAVDDETRSPEHGHSYARSAAIRLRKASWDIGATHQLLDAALAYSARIIWTPPREQPLPRPPLGIASTATRYDVSPREGLAL